jgi:predicted 3-demethylubiquinone-9 3-methyltransferase (glyoxalase superfamily)
MPQPTAAVRLAWDALVAVSGEHGRCGWLKDRFGVSRQVIPREVGRYLGGPHPDGARRATEAILQMGRLDVEALRRTYLGDAPA